jgi:hypothetical protein
LIQFAPLDFILDPHNPTKTIFKRYTMATVIRHLIFEDGSGFRICQSTQYERSYIEARNSDGSTLNMWIDRCIRVQDLAVLESQSQPITQHQGSIGTSRELFPEFSRWYIIWQNGDIAPHLRHRDTGIVRNLGSSNGRIVVNM